MICWSPSFCAAVPVLHQGPGSRACPPPPPLHRSIFLSTCLICSFCPSLQADTWPGSGDQYQSRPCRRTPSAATLPILAAPDTSVKLTRIQKTVNCVSKHSKNTPTTSLDLCLQDLPQGCYKYLKKCGKNKEKEKHIDQYGDSKNSLRCPSVKKS